MISVIHKGNNNMDAANERELFICNICKKIYTSSEKIIMHLLCVHGKEPTIEKLHRERNKRMKKRRKNNNHKSKATQMDCTKISTTKERKYSKEYHCDCCDYKTVYLSTYKRHWLTHEKGSRVHKCEYCSFATIQPYNLQRHLRNVHPLGEVDVILPIDNQNSKFSNKILYVK